MEFEEFCGDLHDLWRLNSEDGFTVVLHRASTHQRDRREGFGRRLWGVSASDDPAVEQIEQQVEAVYDEDDDYSPWVIIGNDGDRIVSERIPPPAASVSAPTSSPASPLTQMGLVCSDPSQEDQRAAKRTAGGWKAGLRRSPSG